MTISCIFKSSGVDDKDVVDDTTISDLNVGVSTPGPAPPPPSSIEQDLNSVITTVTNYQDIITNLDMEARNLNITIDGILQQIDDLVNGKVDTADFDLGIKQEDLETLAATGGSLSESGEEISDPVSEPTPDPYESNVSEMIAKLKLDVVSLQSEAVVLQESAQDIAQKVSEVMGFVSSGDIEKATKLVQDQLYAGELDDLETAISRTSFGAAYPQLGDEPEETSAPDDSSSLEEQLSSLDLDDLVADISSISFGVEYPQLGNLAEEMSAAVDPQLGTLAEEMAAAVAPSKSDPVPASGSGSETSSSGSDSDSNSDSCSDCESGSDSDSDSDSDEGKDEPKTLGNYTNPFPTEPQKREMSTLAHHHPLLNNLPQHYGSSFYFRFPPLASKSSIYQAFMRRRLLSTDKSGQDILSSVAAENFVPKTAPSPNLATYTPKRASAKRRSLDSRAKKRAIPDTKIKRALGFGALAASVGWGTISEMAKRSINDPMNEKNKSALLSDENVERIVSKLCQMRGAALKIGQMISIQDEGLISPEFAQIMARVRENADFMPDHQFEAQMKNNLGEDWRSKFQDFEMIPFAAASLGQVHYATLHDGAKVVVKVQYPGVAESINSDIDNLTAVLSIVDLVPKGAHVDQALRIAKKELAYETDYLREADSQEKMRALLKGDPDFEVPKVYRELTSKHVLTQEFVEGDPIDNFVDAPIELKNAIGLKMLKLCLRELFEFQLMQTDPNWSNFFYDTKTKKIKLLDFGATLELTEEFSDNYLQVIRSCATEDRQAIIDASIKMGFLSGYESEIMLDAHCEAIKVVGEPFATDEPYDFVEKAAYKRVAKLLEVFSKHRITAPPEESYALNRKLSGAFLLCNKLNAVIPCKPLFDKVYEHKMNL